VKFLTTPHLMSAHCTKLRRMDTSMTTKAAVSSKPSLMDAVDAGDFSRVSQLLQEGNNPNFSSGNGWTPLMLAVLNNSADVAELLLKNGADPNLVTESQENPKRSPLAVAVRNGRLELVKLLLAYHADAALTDPDGRTPLELAQSLAQRSFRKEAMQSIVSVLREHQTKGIQHGLLMTSAA